MIDCRTDRDRDQTAHDFNTASPDATTTAAHTASGFPELWGATACHSAEERPALILPLADVVKRLASWLALLIPPDQVVELRALHIQRQRFTKAESGFYQGSSLDKLAEDALRVTPFARGVYLTLNPLNPDLLARRSHRLEYAESGDGASDADVLARHWLFVDIDPHRLAKISATDEEKARAWDVLLRAKDDLTRRGWPAPVVCDSGNGFYLLYRTDEPADDGGRHRRILEYLKARHDTEHVKIDTAVYNPARLCKVPGTWARKGDPTPQRPHRVASILEVPQE